VRFDYAAYNELRTAPLSDTVIEIIKDRKWLQNLKNE
jgi:hypothetical protein